MNRTEAQEICGRVLRLTSADETFVVLHSTENETISFSSGILLPTAAGRDSTIQISVRIGDRYAALSANRLDDSSLRYLLSRATSIASRLPQAQEIIHYQGAAEIAESPMVDEQEASEILKWRSDSARRILELAESTGYDISGFVATSRNSTAVASSNGLFAFQPSTQASCQLYAYAPDKSAVGISQARSFRRAGLNPHELALRSVETARASLNPIDIKAERLTVILEPQAVAELFLPVMRQFDQQAVDENRSFLRKLDGSSRLGHEVFSKEVSIGSDAYNAAVPALPFTLDGQELSALHWVKNGVISNLSLSRFEAQRKKLPAVPFPANFIMDGGNVTLEEMISTTERGLLVRGFGPVTIEDPTNCMLAASTRGGLFLIEEGRISRPVRNQYMRDTAVHLFRETDAISGAVHAEPLGSSIPMLLPAIRVPHVKFTGPSGIV